jgi:hypothetical protein
MGEVSLGCHVNAKVSQFTRLDTKKDVDIPPEEYEISAA